MKGIDVARKYLNKYESKDYKELNKFLRDESVGHDITIDVRETPWCACFVNACEREAGFKGNGRQNARSFLTYGDNISLPGAKEGDIVVFSRGNSSWQGHVAYYLKHDSTYIYHLGGNQYNSKTGASDQVNMGRTPITKLLGIRRSTNKVTPDIESNNTNTVPEVVRPDSKVEPEVQKKVIKNIFNKLFPGLFKE